MGAEVDDAELVARLKHVLDDDKAAATLTPAEVKRLRAMLETYNMFLSSGRLGKWFLSALILLAAGVAAAIKLAEYFGYAKGGG